jgi:hypothetical protein
MRDGRRDQPALCQAYRAKKGEEKAEDEEVVRETEDGSHESAYLSTGAI